jgi:hypothetical protein
MLSVNVRLQGMVARLRQYAHAKHDAAKEGLMHKADAYIEQVSSLERRAEMIRRCFVMALLSLAGTTLSCLLLGLGVYWTQAAEAAVVVFVLAMLCLLAATLYYLREVSVALSAVREEVRDSRFMDLGTPPEARGPEQESDFAR